MAIERHNTKDGRFHTIQGLLECGNCLMLIPNITNDGEAEVTCVSCGSQWIAEDLADANVEDLVERLNSPANCVPIGESRILELEEKESKYDKLREILERVAKECVATPQEDPHLSHCYDSLTAETVLAVRAALGEE